MDLFATFKEVLSYVLERYIELFEQLLRRIAQFAGLQASISLKVGQASVDERLAKLEIAKAALTESMDAIDELQREAELRKREHQEVLADLAATMASKSDAEKKLEAIQSLMNQDVEAFRTLAGVTNVRRERLIGFASGVAASIIASILYALAMVGLRKIGWVS